MLVRDPRKRITPQQALEHPWLIAFTSSSLPPSLPPSSSSEKEMEEEEMEVVIVGGREGGREGGMDDGSDKTERLGGCVLRSQYGSPLCVVS